jgi:PAS domain S-box-containing protein
MSAAGGSLDLQSIGPLLARLRTVCRTSTWLQDAAPDCLAAVRAVLRWPVGVAFRITSAGTEPLGASCADGDPEVGRLLAAPVEPEGAPPQLWGARLDREGVTSIEHGADRALALGISAAGMVQATLLWLGPAEVPAPAGAEALASAVGDLLAALAERERATVLAAEAEESEEKFRALSEAAFEGVALHERGRILLANQAFAQLLGFDSAEEMEGLSALDLAAPGSRALVEENIRSGYAQPYAVMALTRDGRSFPAELRGRTMSYRDRSVRVTAAHDISERKLAEAERSRLVAELQVALAAAQRAVATREEFLSIASHELRTPLTSLQLALQSLEPAPQERRAVEVALRQVDRLCRLVDDLLDVTRLQVGRLELRVERDVDLGNLVNEVVGRFSAELGRAGCAVRLHLQPGVTGTWDRSRLDQIVTNLLSNVLKYAAGAPVDITVDGDDGEAHLGVRDRGIGISAEHLPRLFGAFERAVSTEHYGGMGLGLYIVRRMAELHGGRAEAKSPAGEDGGSRFHVRLPRRPPGDGEGERS